MYMYSPTEKTRERGYPHKFSVRINLIIEEVI